MQLLHGLHVSPGDEHCIHRQCAMIPYAGNSVNVRREKNLFLVGCAHITHSLDSTMGETSCATTDKFCFRQKFRFLLRILCAPKSSSLKITFLNFKIIFPKTIIKERHVVLFLIHIWHGAVYNPKGAAHQYKRYYHQDYTMQESLAHVIHFTHTQTLWRVCVSMQ